NVDVNRGPLFRSQSASGTARSLMSPRFDDSVGDHVPGAKRIVIRRRPETKMVVVRPDGDVLAAELPIGAGKNRDDVPGARRLAKHPEITEVQRLPCRSNRRQSRLAGGNVENLSEDGGADGDARRHLRG